MSNGKVCCILGVCCAPGSAEQREALAAELIMSGSVAEGDAQGVAEWILEHFDLAPAGSLAQFKRDVAALVQRGRGGA